MNNSAIFAIVTAILIMTAMIVSSVTGCGKSETEDVFFTEESSPRFTTIESQMSYKIAIDTQTGVEYLFTSKGNVTVLVDQEGKPYIANGWRDYGE